MRDAGQEVAAVIRAAFYILLLIAGGVCVGLGVRFESYPLSAVGAIATFAVGTWNGRLWERDLD